MSELSIIQRSCVRQAHDLLGLAFLLCRIWLSLSFSFCFLLVGEHLNGLTPMAAGTWVCNTLVYVIHLLLDEHELEGDPVLHDQLIVLGSLISTVRFLYCSPCYHVYVSLICRNIDLLMFNISQEPLVYDLSP